MLRIHFTADDLLRTTFAAAPAPLLELALAVAVMRQQGGNAVFNGWRRGRRRDLPDEARPLPALIPPNGKGPMFLDPISDGLTDGLDKMRSAPDAMVAKELRRVFHEPPPWIRQLSDRDRDSWQAVVAAVTSGYRAILGDDWPRVRIGHASDLAFRGRLMLSGGWRGVLAGLFPGAGWRGSILHLPYSSDRDVHLGGRGMTLMSSAFWTGGPLLAHHADGSRIMVYPALLPLPLISNTPGRGSLGALLGPTRAAVLHALVSEHNTGRLARRLGIAAATASEHAKTLRAAGLVHSRREGQEVRHCCTPLGLQLLGEGRF